MTLERGTRARIVTLLVLLLVLSAGFVMGVAMDRQVLVPKLTAGDPEGSEGRERGSRDRPSEPRDSVNRRRPHDPMDCRRDGLFASRMRACPRPAISLGGTRQPVSSGITTSRAPSMS